MEVILRRPAARLNGCARASARIRALVEARHPTRVGQHYQLYLTLHDELELRDCTEPQLGSAGLRAARASPQVWRRFLVAYFERQYAHVHFDARQLRVSG